MNFIEITGKNAITQAMELVERFLEHPSKRVFFITGFYGIGKRTALGKLLEAKNITPVIHHYTYIKNAELIDKQVKEFPDKVHLWDDVFRSNVMSKDVLQLFRDLENSSNPFQGKFILVANDQEFPKYIFPDLPGVWIHLNKHDLVENTESEERKKGLIRMLRDYEGF